MSFYRYYSFRNHKSSENADSVQSTSRNCNIGIEKCETVERFSLVDCFSIKEIARSISEKLGSKEDLLSDEACELIAKSCFKNLALVIEKGLLHMNRASRKTFTTEDFKMGIVCSDADRFNNLPSSFFSVEENS